MTDHATILHTAQRTAVATAQFGGPDLLDLAGAYRVQRRLIDLRAGDGEHVTGLKLGFTSRAKMRQMGVDQLIAGQLTSAMEAADGGSVRHTALVHPRVEPELVFRLGRDITPELDPQSLANAVDGVAVGLEVIDSRYTDFRFSLPDVVADNASAAHYALGLWQQPEQSLANLGVLLEIDGRIVETGSTAAILGDPWRALRSAVSHAEQYGIALTAGQVILDGAATSAHPFPAGSVARATMSRLGSATLRMSAGSGGRS